jgi:peptidoglycan/xylan/chitin deacetylase (PgdA/CDA1 family)
VRTVLHRTSESGGILLLHDTHKSTETALPSIIARYKEKEFEFTGVTELLADKYDVELKRQAQGLGQ